MKAIKIRSHSNRVFPSQPCIKFFHVTEIQIGSIKIKFLNLKLKIVVFYFINYSFHTFEVRYYWMNLCFASPADIIKSFLS